MSHHRKGSKRQARRASIERKRNAFGTGKTPNEKPGIAPGLYNFDADGAFSRRPGGEPNPRTTEDRTHELFT